MRKGQARGRYTWRPPDPGSGGVKIPPEVQERTRQRVEKFAAEHYAGTYTQLDFRFKGQFCYIDTYTAPEPYPPFPGYPESEEEYYARMRNTPVHLCRLRYLGDEEHWGMAFYKYSDEKYELSVFNTGSFYGTPEEGFDTAAFVYLAIHG